MAGKKIQDMIKLDTYAKQLGAGILGGWIAASLTVKLGRKTAFILGTGVIVYELAHHKGFVKEDLGSVQGKVANKMQGAAKNSKILSAVKSASKNHRVLATGFVSGFLISSAFQ